MRRGKLVRDKSRIVRLNRLEVVERGNKGHEAGSPDFLTTV